MLDLAKLRPLEERPKSHLVLRVLQHQEAGFQIGCWCFVVPCWVLLLYCDAKRVCCIIHDDFMAYLRLVSGVYTL